MSHPYTAVGSVPYISYLCILIYTMQVTQPIMQGKRTLPREVLKWMQGLDLSYSLKDYRKDLANGFLIGQIISRYEPGKIPMHAFQNSQNTQRIENNWSLIELFFTKHTLRSCRIEAQEYSHILSRRDSEQLYSLVCRLYAVCTQRSLPQATPSMDLPPTHSTTTAYLLKEEGPEPIHNSNVSTANNHNDRVPTRKIVPSSDSQAKVEIMGVGVRADGRKATSKRKSWEKEEPYEEENLEEEKEIYDYLDEIIENCITDNQTKEALLIEGYRPVECLRMHPNLSKEFLPNFINQLQLNCNEFASIVQKDVTDMWKFLIYFMKMIRHRVELPLVISLLKTYALHFYNKDPKKITKLFIDQLFSTLIHECSLLREWAEREKIMQLTYDFTGRSLPEKKTALAKLKQLLGSNSGLYLEWLSVLVRNETTSLLDDFLYYAHQHLSSSDSLPRTSALKIFYQVSRSESIDKITPFFLSKAPSYTRTHASPEQTLLLILIYFNILREIIRSKDYETLIKGTNTNHLIKVYNPDNEKNTEDMKKKIELLGNTIHSLVNSTADESVREITARLAIDYIVDVKELLHIYLEFASKAPSIELDEEEYSLKHFTYYCPAAPEISEHANEILVEIIQLRDSCPISNYLPLVNLSLEHLNIKKVNMEIWEDISQHIVAYYCELLKNQVLEEEVVKGVKYICAIVFGYDMKIAHFEEWMKNALGTCSKQAAGSVLECLEKEYAKCGNESSRNIIDSILKIK